MSTQISSHQTTQGLNRTLYYFFLGIASSFQLLNPIPFLKQFIHLWKIWKDFRDTFSCHTSLHPSRNFRALDLQLELPMTLIALKHDWKWNQSYIQKPKLIPSKLQFVSRKVLQKLQVRDLIFIAFFFGLTFALQELCLCAKALRKSISTHYSCRLLSDVVCKVITDCSFMYK